jgi:hypothetical protein
MFLNPGLSFEIFPYWLILIFNNRTLKLYLKELIIVFVLFLTSIFLGILKFGFNNLFIIDSLQALSVCVAVIFYLGLNKNEKDKLCGYFKYYIWFQFIIVYLQTISPQILEISARMFSGRSIDIVLSALNRNNSVIGLSPEPSYASSLLCGIYFLIITHFRRINLPIFVLTLLSLFFYKSVYGFLLFIILSALYEFSIKRYKYVLYAILLFIPIFLFYFDGVNQSSRLILFINYLFDTGSIVQAEKIVSPDSTRIESIVNMFNNFFHYTKSISLSVYLVQSFPIIVLFIYIYLVTIKFRYNAMFFIAVTISSFSLTPLLVWPTIAGLLQIINNKKYLD